MEPHEKVAKIVGLIDRPDTHSFGICAMLVDRADGKRYFEKVGFAGGTQADAVHKVFKDELEDRISEGMVTRVDVALPKGTTNPIALVIGNKFAEKVQAISYAPALPSQGNWHEYSNCGEQSGKFRVMEPQRGYRLLRNWARNAAQVSLEHSDHNLARYALSALPSCVEAMAAVYYTLPRDEAAKELAWEIRLLHDNGKSTTRDDLLGQYKRAYIRMMHKKPPV